MARTKNMGPSGGGDGQDPPPPPQPDKGKAVVLKYVRHTRRRLDPDAQAALAVAAVAERAKRGDSAGSLQIRESVYDEDGNLLDEKPIDADEAEKRKKIAMVRNKVEDLIQHAKSSKE